MKTKFMVLICTAVMMAGCCGKNQSSSACAHDHHGHDHGDGKACVKETAPADMKKIISAQVFIKPEKVNEFVAATQSLIEKSRAEEGCIGYSLYQDPQDKTKFLFFEEWKNQAAVDIHFATEHFKKFGETLNACASAPAVITVYDSPAEKKM